MEEIGRRLFKKVRMKVRFSKTCLRHCDGRLQQTDIPDTMGAAILLDHAGMYFNNLLEGQEKRFFHLSARRLNIFPYRRFPSATASRKAFCFFSSLTGEMIRHFPSVVTERGVSSSISRRSRIGRSIINARLFPCFVSRLTIVSS